MVQIDVPPKYWVQRKKDRKHFQEYHDRGWVAARIKPGPNWWTLDDHLLDVCHEMGEGPVHNLYLRWSYVPKACLEEVARRLGPDAHRLQARWLVRDDCPV